MNKRNEKHGPHFGRSAPAVRAGETVSPRRVYSGSTADLQRIYSRSTADRPGGSTADRVAPGGSTADRVALADPKRTCSGSPRRNFNGSSRKRVYGGSSRPQADLHRLHARTRPSLDGLRAASEPSARRFLDPAHTTTASLPNRGRHTAPRQTTAPLPNRPRPETWRRTPHGAISCVGVCRARRE